MNELVHQTRLAHPRLADDRHYLPLTAAGKLLRAAELFQLDASWAATALLGAETRRKKRERCQQSASRHQMAIAAANASGATTRPR
jgi:hypothetical protein